jgi:hypothetical protein
MKFNIPTSRGKNEMKEVIKYFILSHCDEDIARAFEHHSYTLEPLLCQIIRDMKLESLKKETPLWEEKWRDYCESIAELVPALDPTNGTNSRIISGQDAPELGDSDTESGDSSKPKPGASASPAGGSDVEQRTESGSPRKNRGRAIGES